MSFLSLFLEKIKAQDWAYFNIMKCCVNAGSTKLFIGTELLKKKKCFFSFSDLCFVIIYILKSIILLF